MIWLRLLHRAFHAVARRTPPSLLEPTMYQLKHSRSFVHSLVTLATPRPLLSFISHILYSVMSAVLLYSGHCQPLPICARLRILTQYHLPDTLYHIFHLDDAFHTEDFDAVSSVLAVLGEEDDGRTR